MTNLRKLVLSLGIITGVVSPSLLLVPGLQTQLQAQSFPGEWQVSVKFPSTGGGGSTARSAGGGTRGSDTDIACTNSESAPLTVLMPENNVGTMVTDQPHLYWYIPQTQAKEAEFVLLDQQNREVYATTFPLSGDESGIVQLTLPRSDAQTPLMAEGNDYTWFLALVCNPDDRSYDEIVEGTIRRTTLDAQVQAKIDQETSPLNKAQMYAKEGIWTDALMVLAQLRDTQPEEWQNFLESVDLEEIAQEPFVYCCSQTQAQDY